MGSMAEKRAVASVETRQEPTFWFTRRPRRRRELIVGDVMSRSVITVTSNDTLFSAVNGMSENGVSCVVVVDDGRVTGILTERDVLNVVASEYTDFQWVQVSDRMSSPVEVVPPNVSVIDASKIMESKRIRRLPVVKGQRLVGIITHTDITRGLISLSPLGCVGDIMSRKVATVDAEATVAEAARIMSSHHISCVVALRQEQPGGILTEKDLLKRVVALHKDPTRTRVLDVMSLPIVSVQSRYSILGASKMMDKMRLHRLVIVDGRAVCGIVTQTDIMRAVQNAIEEGEGERRSLFAELAGLVRYLMDDLKELEYFLQEVNGFPAARSRPARKTDEPVDK